MSNQLKELLYGKPINPNFFDRVRTRIAMCKALASDFTAMVKVIDDMHQGDKIKQILQTKRLDEVCKELAVFEQD